MSNQLNELNAEEQYVIQEKGTERPFTGENILTFSRVVCICVDNVMLHYIALSTSSSLIVDGLVLTMKLTGQSLK